jgi:prepilin-type N-terminal cleavage/methylation domain-containing protein
MFSRQAAFTLVEIMIVVSIIALLAMIALPSFLRARERAEHALHQQPAGSQRRL